MDVPDLEKMELAPIRIKIDGTYIEIPNKYFDELSDESLSEEQLIKRIKEIYKEETLKK